MEPHAASVNGVLSAETTTITEPGDASENQDPFSGPLKSVAPWNYTFLACLMFVVTSVSLIENFTVMLVTFKFKQLRQPLNYIIVNLSVADFFMSLIGGTISFLTNACGYFFLGRWACVLEGFAVTFFGESLGKGLPIPAPGDLSSHSIDTNPQPSNSHVFLPSPLVLFAGCSSLNVGEYNAEKSYFLTVSLSLPPLVFIDQEDQAESNLCRVSRSPEQGEVEQF